MQAGDLKDRVTIEVRGKKSDGSDGYVEAWSPVRRRISADVANLSGRELERGRQIDARATHQVSVRYWSMYRSELTAHVRIVFHDGVHNRLLEPVEPIREVEDREKLQVICREASK